MGLNQTLDSRKIAEIKSDAQSNARLVSRVELCHEIAPLSVSTCDVYDVPPPTVTMCRCGIAPSNRGAERLDTPSTNGLGHAIIDALKRMLLDHLRFFRACPL